ncbi:MAG: hypothetical protein Q8O94_02370 [bacterium]|nr:hypothetical protein [bacterium]
MKSNNIGPNAVPFPAPTCARLGIVYKLGPAQREEVNQLLAEIVDNDAELVLFRLVWQREHLLEALNDIRSVATGEKQVAGNDTEGMQWIAARVERAKTR